MKKRVLYFIERLKPLGLLFFVIFAAHLNATASDVTYTTEPLAAGNVLQGTPDVIFYVMKVVNTSASDVATNNISLTTSASGTMDNNDVSYFQVFFNDTPGLTGAVAFGNAAGVSSGGTFNVGGYNIIPAGGTKYILFTAYIASAADNGHSIKVNGADNPVSISYIGTTSIINNQTDVAGIQTIVAPALTYASETVAPSNILQGTQENIIYILKVENTSAIAVAMSSISLAAAASGTMDDNDVYNFTAHLNGTANLTGANIFGYASGINSGATTTFYNQYGNNLIPAGSVRYLIFTAYVKPDADHSHTIKIDGSATPVVISSNTSTPAITNNQTDVAGIQTIVAPALTYTSETVAPSNILQNSQENIIYILKVENTSAFEVAMSSISLTAAASGTMDDNDVYNFTAHLNGTANLTGANIFGYASGINSGATTTFYNQYGNNLIPAGSVRYLLFTSYIKPDADENHTIKINGAEDPIVISSNSTTPRITNNQTNIAGKQTIGTPSFTYSTETSAARIIARGTNLHPFYTLKLQLGAIGATITNITAKTAGSYNSTDITSFSLYKNSVPEIAGATLLSTDATSTGNGETLNFDTGYLELDASTTTYLIVRANINASATPGNTFQINGGSNPVVMTNSGVAAMITNSQTNVAGIQTIGIPPAFSPALTNLTGTTDAGLCTALKTYSVGTTGYPTPTVTYVFSGATIGTGAGSGTGSIFNKGLTTVELTASNACDPVAVQTFTVTVTDAQLPTLSISSNISSNTTPGSEGWGCSGLVSIPNAVFSDNCPDIGQLSWSMTGAGTGTGVGQIPSYRYGLGVTTITYSIADAAGNTKTASLTVTITDNENPTITAPANLNAFTNTNCAATGVALGSPVTSDNCSVASVTNNAPAAFPLGATTVTWTVTDGSGNIKTATQTVTVTDNVNPVITAPPAVTATTNTGCTATGVTLGVAVATDNCTASPSITNDAPSSFPIGVTTVTWTATDAAGNTKTATQTVTVTDNILPAITAPANVAATTNTGCTATGVTLGTPVTSDNCAVATVTSNAPTAFPIGVTTVTWIVTDGSGNTKTATQTVTVTDNINPTITAPANITASTNTACTATGVALGTPTTADNCSVAFVTNNPPTSFPLGVTTVTWTVTDAAGNIKTATQTVTVSDDVLPTITAPANISIASNTGCTATGVTLGTATAADNCTASPTITNNAPTAFPLGVTTVIWTATDAAGNMKTTTQTVTVTDNVAPTITAPANIAATTNTGCTATGVTLGTPTTSDNCAAPTITNNAPSAFPLGITTVTWTATDAAGNTKTATQTVTVTDNILPTITAPENLSVSTNSACTATGVTLGTATAADNCTASPTITNNAPTAFPIGTTTVTWTATDAAGNIKTATQTVTVSDDVLPTITAPANISIASNTGCTATGVTLGTATAADNCTASPTITNNAPTIFPSGVTTVTWTATDAAGNIKTATQTVTVTDAIAPAVPTLADITGLCSITPTAPTTTDNCAGTVTGTTSTVFPITAIGTTVIVWTFSDGNGNSVTANQNLIITVSTDIAMSATTSNQTIVAGDNYFQDANCKLVAKVTAGTLGGVTRSKVWIESANVTGPYVKRHYQITPDVNANAATGTITLYFTQAEFNAYSTAVTTAQLPADATDAAGKANLRIVKFPGNSNDAGGLVYDPATAVNIDPLDSDINYLNGRWEVKFEVTGFSGFFVNTISTPLPVTLISFNVKRTVENEITLDWVSSDEKEFDRFDVQRSVDAKSFETIGTIHGLAATNTVLRNYQFVDHDDAFADNYYRLKMVDKDGSFEYSKIIHLGSSTAKSAVGQFYPNPTALTETYIDVVTTETGKWTIKTYNVSGRVLSTENRYLNKGMNKIKISLDKTIYGSSLIQFESKDQVEVRKIIRQ